MLMSTDPNCHRFGKGIPMIIGKGLGVGKRTLCTVQAETGQSEMHTNGRTVDRSAKLCRIYCSHNIDIIRLQ